MNMAVGRVHVTKQVVVNVNMFFSCILLLNWSRGSTVETSENWSALFYIQKKMQTEHANLIISLRTNVFESVLPCNKKDKTPHNNIGGMLRERHHPNAIEARLDITWSWEQLILFESAGMQILTPKLTTQVLGDNQHKIAFSNKDRLFELVIFIAIVVLRTDGLSWCSLDESITGL